MVHYMLLALCLSLVCDTARNFPTRKPNKDEQESHDDKWDDDPDFLPTPSYYDTFFDQRELNPINFPDANKPNLARKTDLQLPLNKSNIWPPENGEVKISSQNHVQENSAFLELDSSESSPSESSTQKDIFFSSKTENPVSLKPDDSSRASQSKLDEKTVEDYLFDSFSKQYDDLGSIELETGSSVWNSSSVWWKSIEKSLAQQSVSGKKIENLVMESVHKVTPAL